MISGIVLAAGSAKRMGQQKLLLELRGKPILQWGLEAALSSELDDVICVVRGSKQLPLRISLEHVKLRWITNERASEGQSTSIISGLKAVSPECEAVLFLVGDQPLMSTALINGLIDLFKKGAALIAAPTFQGLTRNPVLFHKQLFPELRKLTGDLGARGLIEKYRDKAVFLEWAEESPFLDVDIWQDYQKLGR